MKHNVIAALCAGAIALPALTGCHIYKKFNMPADGDGRQAIEQYVESRDQELDSTALGNLPWQQVFTDPMLADLINQALENNVDLENARLNIEIAHANMRGARLSYLPSLTLAPQGGASSWANGPVGNWTYSIPLVASWEVDAFGRILNTKRGAEASYAQSKAYCQAVRSQIIGGVANCYYAIATLKAQLELNRLTAEIWRQNVQTMRDYKEAGRTNEAAVMQSDANYRSVLASITDLEQSLNQAYNNLSLLLGEMPREWAIPAGAALELPAVYSDGAIPMAQLAARPDIAAAERSVAVAYYATNQARSAFYPSITLTATYGWTNPGEWFANLAGQLTAPLFARGQNMARLKGARAQQQQVMNTFEHTLLSAAAEVSNALLAYDRTQAKSRYLATQVDDLVKATDYTGELFKTADATYLEVLTAQSSLLNAQMSQLSCQLASAQAVINLYQSLGGGR